ncbi:hypothetical protein B0H13DRAFT_1854574 [Mycena leptocephala]|nr:hypothetical protein B0H13DRAFT_1854574 [Mycena leptocephala]
MGSTKWATGNKPTRDWEQPAKNWEHVQPMRNGEQLLNGKLGTGYNQHLGTADRNSGDPIPVHLFTAQWQSGIMPDCRPPELPKLPLLGTTITNQNVPQKTVNGQQGANGEQTNKRLGTISQKLGIANRKQGTASQRNQVPTGN